VVSDTPLFLFEFILVDLVWAGFDRLNNRFENGSPEKTYILAGVKKDKSKSEGGFSGEALELSGVGLKNA